MLRNLIGVEQDKADASLPSIFSQNVGYAPNEGTVRFLDNRDHRVAHAYVLSNCGLLKEHERYVTTSYMCFILDLIHILMEIVVLKLYRIFELEMVEWDPRVQIG